MAFKLMTCFLILVSLQAHAIRDCLLADALKDPRLANNMDFWNEYSALNSRSNYSISDADFLKLKEKYNIQNTSDVKVQLSAKDSPRLSVEKKAQKEIEGLPNHLREKVDEFLETALRPNGIKELRENPGRWHFEKLKDSTGVYTVRLNGGYRVMFDMKNDHLNILRVNKGQIHDHHNAP